MWRSRAWSCTKSTSRRLGTVRGVQWIFSIHSAYLLKSQSENKKLRWRVWILIKVKSVVISACNVSANVPTADWCLFDIHSVVQCCTNYLIWKIQNHLHVHIVAVEADSLKMSDNYFFASWSAHSFKCSSFRHFCCKYHQSSGLNTNTTKDNFDLYRVSQKKKKKKKKLQ